MAGLHFDASVDTAQLERDFKRGSQSVGEFVREAEQSASRMDSAFKNAGTAIAGYLTFEFAKNIGSQIIEITGEFQQLSVAFTTMLGSKERANQLMQQMVNTAASTPFSLTQVADGAKRLLAYGQSADTVNDTLIRLGNVASGASVPLDRVILAYGQVKAKGKLQGDDMRQFMEMGLPLVHQLALQLGVADTAISKMVESGQVGFKDVEAVMRNMTNAGGQFYNLMQEQSKTIPGQISNLGDTVDQMFNKIGTANADTISGVISGLSFAVQNYEVFITTLEGVAAAYGGYKAALMLVAAMENTKATMNRANEAAELLKLISVEKQAQLSKLELGKTSVEYAAFVKAEVESNVLATKTTLDKARVEVSAAAQTVEAKRAEYIATKELEAARLAEAMAIGATGTEKQLALAESRLAAAASTREAAALEFKNATQDFSAKKIAVETAAKSANTVSTAVNTAAQAANAESTSFLTLAKTRLLGMMAKVNAMIVANPYAAAAAAVAAFAFIIYKLASQTSALEESQKRLATSSTSYQSAVLSETIAIDTLFGTLQGLTKGTKAYDEAKQAIISKYGGYLEKLDAETRSLNNVAKAYDAITSAVIKASMAKAQSEGAAGAQTAFEETAKPLIEELQANLNDKFGVKKGTELLTKMRLALQDGKGFSKELGDAVNSFTRVSSFQTGSNTSMSNTYTNDVLSIVKNIREARNILKSELKQNAILFGDPTQTSSKPTAISLTVSVQAKQVLEDIKKSEISLRTLRAANSKATADDIKKEEDNLSKLKATYATLTGEKVNTPKASVKDSEAYREQLYKVYSEINKDKEALMKDGFEKEMATIKNAYSDQLAAVSKQEADLLVAYNKSKGLKKGDKSYISQLPEEAKDAIDKLRALAEQAKAAKELSLFFGEGKDQIVEDNSMDALLESTKTFEQKRLDIVGQAMLDIATLENKGLTDQAAVRRKKMKGDVGELEASHRTELKSWAYLYENIDKWGKKALLARVAMLKEDANVSKITAEEKLAINKALADTEEKLRAIAPRAAMRELDEKIAAAKQKIAKADGDAKKINTAQGEIDTAMAKKGAVMSETFSDVAGHLQGIAGIVGQVNEGLGEAIDSASQMANVMSQVASQNYLGAAISFASTIVSTIAKSKKEAEIQAKMLVDVQLNALRETLRLYNEAIGSAKGLDTITATNAAIEKTKNNIKATIDLLGKAKVVIGIDVFDALALGAEGYKKVTADVKSAIDSIKDIKVDKNTSLSDIDAQINNNKKAIESYYDITADLAKKKMWLADQDSINGLIKEYETYIEKYEELLNKKRESITGSTYDSIVDSISSAFDDGVVSAEEFTETFGALMKKQVLNALKMQMLEKPLKDFYAQFALASESGGSLTAEEVIALRATYEKIAADAKIKFDDLNSIMKGAGLDLFGGGAGSKENSAVGIVKNLSENTGTEIVGNLTGMRYDIREQNMTIKEQLGLMNQSVVYQQQIAANTEMSAARLGQLVTRVDAIVSKIGATVTNQNEGRATGK